MAVVGGVRARIQPRAAARAALSDSRVAQLLAAFQADDAGPAWEAFLEHYAAGILQIVRSTERDPERAGDCFVYVCERLAEDRARRLRRYRLNGPARFETWLHVIVCRLAHDWRRQQFGRFRLLGSLAALPALTREVYLQRYERGLTADQTFAVLAPRFPGLTPSDVARAEAAVEANLSSRQQWLLLTRRPRLEPLVQEDSEAVAFQVDPADPGLDPEATALLRDRSGRLRAALAALLPEERLLLRLRFAEDLTLARVAELAGLSGPPIASCAICWHGFVQASRRRMAPQSV